MADETPGFQFDETPPFSYESFKEKFFGTFLPSLEGQGGRFLGDQQGDAREGLARLMYVMTVNKLQHPDMTLPQMLYAVNYGLARHAIDAGQAPEAVLAELSRVPWDTLPGLGEYERESVNAVTNRAFADAIDGTPRPPLH